jgi:hypothetical protein
MATDNSATSPYVVTSVGGGRPTVAGRLRTPGTTIMLTDEQARWERSRKTVVTPGEWEEMHPPAEASSGSEKA